MEYIFLDGGHWRRKQNFAIINQETHKIKQIYIILEPHDYWIDYVNIDLPHYYGISACSLATDLSPGETSLAADACFHRLVMWKLGSVPFCNSIWRVGL